MTKAQAAWLRKLRDEGPQKQAEFLIIDMACQAFGWVRLDLHGAACLTSDGLAALNAFDAKRDPD